MKCEVCGRSTIINWGNESTIVCEEHQDQVAQLQSTKNKKGNEWREGSPRQISVEAEVTSSSLLSVWWAFTWRYTLLMAVIGGFLGLILDHSLESLVTQEALTNEIANCIETGFNLVMAAAFIFITLDRVIGKKIGNVRLVLVTEEPTSNK